MTTTRTVPFTSGAGSAADPAAAEITWAAWELTAADPTRLTVEVVQNITIGFDCLVEAAWQPGRSVLLSECEWEPGEGQEGQLSVRLGIGVLGPLGSTEAEVAGLAPRALEVLRRNHVLATRRIDPAAIVGACDPELGGPAGAGHMVHIGQRTSTIGDDEDLVEVVSRFAPTIEPWSSVIAQLADLDRHVRVRATVLATELSPADRMEIHDGLARVRAIRLRNPDRAEIAFDADRAEATLMDLRASLSSPIVAAEIAVWSAAPLAHTTLRSLAAAFTSESDVLRRQGHVVVASNRLLLGGFEILADPAGWELAQHLGLPLRGGIHPRALTDLLTLTESPLGWPMPIGAGLPATPTQVPIPRRTADVFRPSPEEPSTLLGFAADGTPVHLPLDLRTRHRCITGTTGTGKSITQRAQAIDDLEHGRPFLYLDPHGSSADELVAHADRLGLRVVVIDATDGATDRMQVLPRKGGRGSADAQRAASRFAEALASSLGNPEWTGPRWHATFDALLELVIVHEGELIDGVVWLNDPAALRQRLRHPDLSALSRSTLANIASGTSEGSDVRGWASSKLHPVASGAARRVIAPVGEGIDVGAAVMAGISAIVNLAGLSTSEANLIGHLSFSSVLDHAFDREPDEREQTTCYIDEAPRFPAAGMARAFAEGRKFEIALDIALQSLGQLPRELADLAMGAGTQMAFRATPDTAGRLSPLLRLPAADLLGQPDLQATVSVSGHPPASVVVPIPPTCAPTRVRAALRPLRPPLSERRAAPANDTEPNQGGTAFLDELLDRRRAAAEAPETDELDTVLGADAEVTDLADAATASGRRRGPQPVR